MVALGRDIEHRKEIRSLSRRREHSGTSALKLAYTSRNGITCRILKSGIEISRCLKIKKLTHILACRVFKGCALNYRNLTGLTVSGRASLEAEKAAILRDSKELKEAMESGRYVLKVAQSVDDALDTYCAFLGEASRRNHYSSPYRDHDISLELRNSRIRVANSLETLGRYLQDFAAELKDLIGQPEQVIPTPRIEEVLIWISGWVRNSTAKRHGGSSVLGELTPLVEALEQAYAAREAACAEIDERIRAMVMTVGR